jgi:DNA-binding NarL/FixJ family response regulator
MSPRQRILVADGSKYFDSSIWRMLMPEPEFDIVGQAHNTEDAISMAGTLTPDIILADLSHSDMRGLQTVQTLHNIHPTIPIVTLSPLASQEYSQAALDAGAAACVTKSDMAEMLLHTLQGLSNNRPANSNGNGYAKNGHLTPTVN